MDDKDWTWVLERPCPECGVDSRSLDRDQLAGHTRAVGAAWRQLLGRSRVANRPPTAADDADRAVSTPHARTWSPLEYGCHVRDVFEVFEKRLREMLKSRKPPTFRNWDQEQAAIEGDYANADPAKVAYELATRAGKYADVIDRVSGDEWDKQGVRSDGAAFTVESLTRYMLHDVEHHLWDARQILDN
jgi:hypothetical protein